jgi:hypothetical protein
MLAGAQVPGLINYQGRLTDANGAPVTGSKNFSLSIYDAATGGNLLYTEDIGAVTLDANGVYSFQFGSAGTSNTQISETVATTNGTSATFQKVLGNSPVVAGSVSVTDGTYTWSQSAGSSNEDDFGVAYSTSLRRVTVNYYNGAPAVGRTITATYRYGTSGITGSLSSGAEHWMEVTVDGTAQGTRQRVLTVPFAVQSLTSKNGVDMSLGYIPIELSKPFQANYSGMIIAESGYSHSSNAIAFVRIRVAKSEQELTSSPIFELRRNQDYGSLGGEMPALIQLPVNKGLWIQVDAPPSVVKAAGKAYLAPFTQ